MVMTTNPRPKALSAALTQSNFCGDRWLSGKLRQPKAKVSSPSGRLIAKSHGQLTNDNAIPAKAGPTVEAPATTIAFIPIAAPNRSFATV
ncbi:hypothetical protein GALL_550550 [mine drainage metagenome]|uniref:Uncharacterized protein n=1 Tax=mine drainage metagenome TaxID=410659 RepID=A0A1J5PIL4_9ZZZZ